MGLLSLLMRNGASSSPQNPLENAERLSRTASEALRMALKSGNERKVRAAIDRIDEAMAVYISMLPDPPPQCKEGPRICALRLEAKTHNGWTSFHIHSANGAIGEKKAAGLQRAARHAACAAFIMEDVSQRLCESDDIGAMIARAESLRLQGLVHYYTGWAYHLKGQFRAALAEYEVAEVVWKKAMDAYEDVGLHNLETEQKTCQKYVKGMLQDGLKGDMKVLKGIVSRQEDTPPNRATPNIVLSIWPSRASRVGECMAEVHNDSQGRLKDMELEIKGSFDGTLSAAVPVLESGEKGFAFLSLRPKANGKLKFRVIARFCDGEDARYQADGEGWIDVDKKDDLENGPAKFNINEGMFCRLHVISPEDAQEQRISVKESPLGPILS